MQKMFPKMQVVELDGGHWIHVDQLEGVIKTMHEKRFNFLANFRSKFVQKLNP